MPDNSPPQRLPALVERARSPSPLTVAVLIHHAQETTP